MKIASTSEAFFDINSSILTDDAKNVLGRFTQMVLRSNKKNRVWIEGHADEGGTAQYHLQLSQLRSTAVAAQLELFGIDPEQLKIVFYGDTRPISLNKTQSNDRNRRVTVTLMEID